MTKIKKSMSEISSGILLSICLGFMICVYAPLEMFLTNQNEFWFELNTIIMPVAVFFIGISIIGIIGFILLRLIGKKVYYVGLAVGLGALICFYIQGNFLVSGLPALDGTNINWNAGSIERVKSIVLWTVIIIISFFILVKFKSGAFGKITSIISVCMLLLLGITLATLLLTTDIKKNSSQLISTNKNEFQLSDNMNVIVFMLDAVDNNDFKAVLKNNPEYEDIYKDFTYFDNVASGYPYTQMAVPLIMTGKWYENTEPFDEYMSKAFDTSPLINTLEKKNYKIGIYDMADIILDSATHEGRYENQLSKEETYNSLFSCIKLMRKMAGVKYFPWDAKRFCYNLVKYAQNIRVIEDMEYEPFNWSNVDFYNKVKDYNPITKVNDKCFRFIHLEGAHVPYQYDKNMNIIEDGTYADNIEASITLCREYIRCLKESGVYDNSAIVIMADHGFDKNYESWLKRVNPILLVKGVEEKNDKMKISSAPISHGEISQSIADLTDGKSAEEMFQYKDGDSRDRRVMIYEFSKEQHIEEYTLNGRADDVSAMKLTGRLFDDKGNGIYKGEK